MPVQGPEPLNLPESRHLVTRVPWQILGRTSPGLGEKQNIYGIRYKYIGIYNI